MSSIKQSLSDLKRQQIRRFGREGIRAHPVQETGKVQARNVRLTVRGRMDVYDSGEIKEQTPVDETEYVTIKFRTNRQLHEGIQQQLDHMKDKVRVLEVDSPKKVFYET
jgi:hypothetical protein